MNKTETLDKVRALYNMWKNGELGGEYMPEDSNPQLEKSSIENYNFFTLPMALNYQRNSYKLWESAVQTYLDETTKFVFNVNEVLNRTTEEVKIALTKYKVALQQNKQTEIWIKLCQAIKSHFNGDIRKLFSLCEFDVNEIRNYIQITHKKDFPYISGNKICNYWLFVLSQYTDLQYKNLEELTIAPDTHVIQATKKLGIISQDEFNKPDVQKIVIKKWEVLLQGSEFCPIQLHTALWLWSRNGFKEIL